MCIRDSAYVNKEGKEEWSPVYHFYIDEHIRTFNPPSLQEVLTKLPKTHPRILLDAEDWDNIIERNKNNPEAQAYILSLIHIYASYHPLPESNQSRKYQ